MKARVFSKKSVTIYQSTRCSFPTLEPWSYIIFSLASAVDFVCLYTPHFLRNFAWARPTKVQNCCSKIPELCFGPCIAVKREEKYASASENYQIHRSASSPQVVFKCSDTVQLVSEFFLHADIAVRRERGRTGLKTSAFLCFMNDTKWPSHEM